MPPSSDSTAATAASLLVMLAAAGLTVASCVSSSSSSLTLRAASRSKKIKNQKKNFLKMEASSQNSRFSYFQYCVKNPVGQQHCGLKLDNLTECGAHHCNLPTNQSLLHF